MNANELAEGIETIAQNNSNLDEQIRGLMVDTATMLRQQQDEIDAIRNRFTLAFWHDTFVEVKKPNSDLIYRFKLDETNDI